jgi:signal transduction histidine kinase/DNA-binding response OmpR family regulator
MNSSISTLYAGAAVLGSAVILFFVLKQIDYLSFFVCTGTQLVFIFVGAYLHELDFYFFMLLLLVGIVSASKNFRMMAIFLALNILINLLVIIFLVPHLEWLNHFRFFMQFAMYLYGSLFMLVQTFNVTQKETRAEQARSSFSSLLRNTPNYMVITDSDCRVRYVSQQMAEFAHFTKQEYAVGQPLIDLFSDWALKLMFADILDSGGFVETVMTVGQGEDERHFKVIADKLSGDAEGLFIDISDITPTIISKKNAERDKARAEAANTSKSRFLANMSHEIRTPMNAIIGITEMELEREEILPETREGLRKIYNSGYTLLGIINDILDLSKIETGKLELNPVKYDVASLINDAVHLNIMRIGSKPLEFSLQIPANLPSQLTGDELRIKQIMNNLLSNAFKYTESGTVTLEMDTKPFESEPGEDFAWLVISVRDTGQGMTAEEVARIYDEYSRFNTEANRMTEGTGLGMNITQNLVKMMDGKIDIESVPGVGTAFTVTIRQKATGGEVIGRELADNLKNFHYSTEMQMMKAPINREYMPYGSVLVVDDVDTNLYVAKGLLAPYGLKIETAESGFETLDRIQSGAVYDIVFMDHMMPKMDGIEATMLLREAGYAHPIVALTANAVAGQSEIFRENGFDDFISKPIDIRQMNAVLNRLIRDKQPTEVIQQTRKEMPDTAEPDLETNTELLEIFARDARKALPILETTLLHLETATNEDLRLFVTTTHAMKSALGNVGEAKASVLASVLEKAGNQGDKAVISAETPNFIDALITIVARIELETKTDDSGLVENEDLAFLAEQLEMIRAACAEYDNRVAEQAIKDLKTHKWSSEIKTFLIEMDELIFHSDFEKAELEAADYIVILQKKYI